MHSARAAFLADVPLRIVWPVNRHVGAVPRPAQQHNFRALDAGAPVLALGWKAPILELQGVPVFPDPAPWPFQPCLANFWQAGLPKTNLTISEERTRSWLKEVGTDSFATDMLCRGSGHRDL